MGWLAITREFETIREEIHGRPLKDGEDGKLLMIAQQDYEHRVAVDLVNGVIILDYEILEIRNGTIEIEKPKIVFYICDETTRAGEYFHTTSTEPDAEGNYFNTFTPLVWRPIWFSRVITTLPAPIKCIGAQTTLPSVYGGQNVKKLISLFPDGSIGID